MPKLNYPAVRALARALRPILRAQDLAADADAGFDGGEWSAPWHDLARERAIEDAAAAIAPRFGLAPEELLEQSWIAEHVQQDFALAAIIQGGSR